ncbi:hypothetical protein MKW98_029342 [Papaver atlanticum]|uniref:Ribosomal protein S6 n=1 Tax=Papaver atlanticum TaxID=357466 RepID=A0AAD4SIA2_9MAGN|nr:hypothetical protein MKW98_029342 [Papaver atlanticum]
MPLYDCMLLLKPKVGKELLIDLVGRVGKHVYRRNGVLTEVRSFGKVNLGYGIKKLDGRHYEGQLMQMTMMVTPNFNKELQYLNKENRLLRWLLVKHRGTDYGVDTTFDHTKGDYGGESLGGRSLFNDRSDEDDEDDEDEPV